MTVMNAANVRGKGILGARVFGRVIASKCFVASSGSVLASQYSQACHSISSNPCYKLQTPKLVDRINFKAFSCAFCSLKEIVRHWLLCWHAS